MRKVKVGIIGCGSIATHRHLPEYMLNDHVEIVAVCDSVEERAKEKGRMYHANFYTDYKELLSDSNIEAVSVCTPNYLHAPITIAALNAGKHVLCEKPMATSKEEALAMIEAAERNNRKLMIAHNQRLVESHVQAKKKKKNHRFRRNRKKYIALERPLDMVVQKAGVLMGRIVGSFRKRKPLLELWEI